MKYTYFGQYVYTQTVYTCFPIENVVLLQGSCINMSFIHVLYNIYFCYTLHCLQVI